jgi:ribosomal protein S3AE
VKEKIAHTTFDGLECTRDYISRMVLHRVKRLDVIKNIVSKDGVKLRVKVLVVTPKGIGKVAAKEMRKKTAEIVEDFIKNHSIDEILIKILNDEVKQATTQLRKIYPVRYFEIRKIEVL